jgi:endonuclease/exonuclease/phosphatase family metal-dependent hydrolase
MRHPSLLLLVQFAAICLCSNLVYAADIVEQPETGAVNVQEGADPGPGAERPSLRVMTFNIRWQGNDNGKFVESGFDRRKPLVLDVLTKFGADVIGLQEASIEQRAEIAPELPGFGMFPPPTEAGDECILYRLSRFVLGDSGHEQLRRVPEKPDTNIGVRDFVWVYLHDRISDKRFYVLSLHTDHRSSKRGRQLDGVLIGEWIRKRETADPVILTGDFNGTPDKPRYLYLTGQKAYSGEDGKTVRMPMPMLDTFTVANPNARYPGTSNSGYKGKKNKKQIDYIFVPRGTTVIDSRIIYYHANGSYPSDHFPLLSEFELK